MSTLRTLTVDAGDDPIVALTATTGILPYDFTGRIVEMLIKATRETSDAAATAILRSDGVTPKITIVGTVATADLTDLVDTPGTYWYRARVYEGTRKRSFLKGPLVVETS